MHSKQSVLLSLGNLSPISVAGARPLDRRDVSLRWLAATLLVALGSSLMMGAALLTAAHGSRFPLPDVQNPALSARPDTAQTARFGDRVLPAQIRTARSTREIIDVPTVERQGDIDIVRRQPYAITRLSLAARYRGSEDYPRFDPVALHAENPDERVEPDNETFYAADLESNVKVQTRRFPSATRTIVFDSPPGIDEVEEGVRLNGALLTADAQTATPTAYVDPTRFSDKDDPSAIPGIAARVLEENVSTALATRIAPGSPDYFDDIIPVQFGQAFRTVLSEAGYDGDQLNEAADAVALNAGSKDLEAGDLLRLGVVTSGQMDRIVEISLYRTGRRRFTVAENDRGVFVNAPPPQTELELTADGQTTDGKVDQTDAAGTVYDGIFRAALANGLSQKTVMAVMRALSKSVDLKAPIKRSDRLVVFSSVANDHTAAPKIAYIGATINGQSLKLYGFQPKDEKSIDFYDEDGISARQFLLRSPLTHGRVSSGFGMRRHPILGFATMHEGVDWAAPKGTAILATGDGVVAKAGPTSGGYGNQTIIRHANGYVSSYNHQNAIAKGIRAGAKVHQGQVIGWVGSTGRSTGPHIHYEIAVNGNRVDPLTVRFPDASALKGQALADFSQQRDRIDDLLDHQVPLRLASSN
jgi:murein DD-endopeptidase MepM/ murein hydrolase activator NlpD